MITQNINFLTLLLGGLFALIIIVALASLGYLLNHYLRERKKGAWRKFAAQNQLIFKPGQIPHGSYVVGPVDGRQVSLTLRQSWRLFGGRLRTEMTLSSAEASLLPENRSAAAIAAVDLLRTIHYCAFGKPMLQRRSPERTSSSLNIIRSNYRLLAGKPVLEEETDDYSDLTDLRKTGQILEDLIQKLADIYDLEAKSLLANRPLLVPTPDFSAVADASDQPDGDSPLEHVNQTMQAATQPVLKGVIHVKKMGQVAAYHQEGLETDPIYLQGLLNLCQGILEAYPIIVDLGRETISFLDVCAIPQNDLRSIVIQLIYDIAAETKNRLGQTPAHFTCLRCLTHCGPHDLSLQMGETITYYGCRACGQSREFFEGQAIIVLNRQAPAKQSQRDEILRIDWLTDRRLFDFDAIEIVDATDEDVERFAVQVGNDTDTVRRPRYEQMRCAVSSTCQLSENTTRILERTFGQVEVIEEIAP